MPNARGKYILLSAAGLAQLVEQSLRKREVGSSSLLAGTICNIARVSPWFCFVYMLLKKLKLVVECGVEDTYNIEARKTRAHVKAWVFSSAGRAPV